jgi:pimeloyl-ACP methyl ester carboxylesterase
MDYHDLNITVPWGHIAAKSWGNHEDPLVLLFHGATDNAGSFDRLIPLLPPSFCYICIDLPGHGKSSHFPPFLPIYSLSFVMVFKMIAQHFNRKKYIIIGHSYGGQLAYTFSQLYPEYVEKLVTLDIVHFYPEDPTKFKNRVRNKLDSCIALMQNNQASVKMTSSEALQKIQKYRSYGNISSEAAEALLQRGLKSVGDGKYEFSADPRIKMHINSFHDMRNILVTTEMFPVTCPILIILAHQSITHHLRIKPFFDHLKGCKNISVQEVEGSHDVHNNNPGVVAPHISKFLLKQSGKL